MIGGLCRRLHRYRDKRGGKSGFRRITHRSIFPLDVFRFLHDVKMNQKSNKLQKSTVKDDNFSSLTSSLFAIPNPPSRNGILSSVLVEIQR